MVCLRPKQYVASGLPNPAVRAGATLEAPGIVKHNSVSSHSLCTRAATGLTVCAGILPDCVSHQRLGAKPKQVVLRIGEPHINNFQVYPP